MATNFTNIRPGGVISSDLMMFVVTKLQEIDDRVGKLETGTSAGQVQISGFVPAVQQNAGRNLTIVGTSFATPATANSVKINGTPVTTFTSPNSDKVLNVVIPSSFVPPADGTVTVTVSNSKGSTSVLYKVLPFIPPTGPDPVIQSVIPVSPAVLILVNKPIHIIGQNFAPASSGDVIRFEVATDSGTIVTYPKPGDPALTFDTGGTSNATNIFVTLPDIAEINPAGPEGERPVTLSLTVGAHPEQKFAFNARR